MNAVNITLRLEEQSILSSVAKTGQSNLVISDSASGQRLGTLVVSSRSRYDPLETSARLFDTLLSPNLTPNKPTTSSADRSRVAERTEQFEVVRTSDGRFKCSVCHKKFLSETYTQMHFGDMHLGYGYRCGRCGGQYAGMPSLSTHMVKIHGFPSSKARRVARESFVKRDSTAGIAVKRGGYSGSPRTTRVTDPAAAAAAAGLAEEMDFSVKPVVLVSRLSDHVLAGSPATEIAQIFPTGVTQDGTTKSHKRKPEKRGSELSCEVCNVRLASVSRKLRHIKQVHLMQRTPCPLCGKRVKHLKSHVTSQHPPNSHCFTRSEFNI